MIRRTTEVQSLVPCPHCDRTLTPIFLESSVAFLCKSGHEVGLSDLLAAGHDAAKAFFAHLVETWQSERESLAETAARARRDRLTGIAEFFQRHAELMDARIASLKHEYSEITRGIAAKTLDPHLVP